MDLTGTYALLKSLPIGLATAVLFFFSIGILHVGRYRLEGLGYNIAWSSEIGDAFLIGYIITGVAILERPGTVLGDWQWSLELWAVYMSAASVILAQALAERNLTEGPREMDVYHNLIVVPVMVYLLITLFPVIWVAGTWMEEAIALFFLVVWASLARSDVKNNRLDQRAWLKGRGILLR